MKKFHSVVLFLLLFGACHKDPPDLKVQELIDNHMQVHTKAQESTEARLQLALIEWAFQKPEELIKAQSLNGLLQSLYLARASSLKPYAYRYGLDTNQLEDLLIQYNLKFPK